MKRIQVIDSHTGGEPTRVVVSGGPNLGTGSLKEQLKRFQTDHDRYREAIIREPRGGDVWVGALLLEPVDPKNSAAVLFFNNVGYLGMCGHGTIGLIRTLAHLGRIQPGVHRVETVVGTVLTELHTDGEVSVINVPAYRRATEVSIQVPHEGRVTGDIAWGGNWFFLVDLPAQPDTRWQRLLLDPGDVESLTDRAWKVRQAVNAQGYPEVDHVEFFGPARSADANASSFVLCPGKAWDRSPCGTGTSAKLACLAAAGKLEPGREWIQESVIGSRFHASYRWAETAELESEYPVAEGSGRPIIPTIRGRAFIMGESDLLLDAADPFQWGIPGLP